MTQNGCGNTGSVKERVEKLVLPPSDPFDWGQVDCICFDVDSTVCTDEAIDELARFAGVQEQVKLITQKAMGSVKSDFATALAERLELIQPSKRLIDTFIQSRIASGLQLTNGVTSLVHTLIRPPLNIDVHLISGGFEPFILPVAQHLGIPASRVHSNRIIHDEQTGAYVGFDRTRMTSQSGGKRRQIAALKKKFGYRCVIMIGDGQTDLETECVGPSHLSTSHLPSPSPGGVAGAPGADLFIGFGANVVRPAVQQQARLFVMSMASLKSLLLSAFSQPHEF